MEAFQKYLIFVFTEDNEFKINFKNNILLVVPKSLRNETIRLLVNYLIMNGIVDILKFQTIL